jgi:peptidoglycan/xylan/chitin deacetylase (PgdA/CDA1 family)
MNSIFSGIKSYTTKIIYNHKIIRKEDTDNAATILAYHEICEIPKALKRKHLFNVTPDMFEKQMEFLSKYNYKVIELKRLISHINKKITLPKKAVVITFDDGYQNNYTNGFNILKKYKYPATIFLATDYIDSVEIFPWFKGISKNHAHIEKYWKPLTWQEIKKMSNENIDIGSHTSSHTNIRKLKVETFEKEIKKSKQIIEKKINKNVCLFSYPYSYPKYRKSFQKMLFSSKMILKKYGFIGACTTIIGSNTLSSDPYSLKRIQIQNNDTLQCFMAKLSGAYNWAGSAQKIYQRFIEPIIHEKSKKCKIGRLHD